MDRKADAGRSDPIGGLARAGPEPLSALRDRLQADNDELRRRLEEAEETIDAIHRGAVDAFVVAEGTAGYSVYTLEGADKPYRLLIEEMQQGAAMLQADGTILYCNRSLAELLGIPHRRLCGAQFRDFIHDGDLATYDGVLRQAQARSGRGEARLRRSDGRLVPAFLMFNALPPECGAAIGALVTDLTTQKHQEQLAAAQRKALAQKRLLEMVAAGKPLAETLDELMLFLEAQEPGMRCDIMIVTSDGQQLRRGSGPHLPEECHNACDGAPITPPYAGPYSEAAHRCTAVLIPDVAAEVRYPDAWRALMACCGVHAVRSIPVVGTGDRALASLTMYFDRPRDPGPTDPELAEIAAHVAAIAIEHDLVEVALRDSERRYRDLVNVSNQVVYRSSPDWSEMYELSGGGLLVDANSPDPNWLERYIHPDDQQHVRAALQEAIRAKSAFELEYRALCADASFRWIASHSTPVLDENGGIIEWFGAGSDVTKRKHAEEALRESEDRLRHLNEELESRVRREVAAREKMQARLAHTQRMQALGQLAGGIAYDFNNVIQAVQGGAAMIERRPGDAERVRELAHLVAETADRGSAITRRLLTFSRRADLRAEAVDAASLFSGIEELFSRTLGAGVIIRIESEPDLPPLFADRAQLETALVNLATNARDAMQGVGTLTFAAAAEVVADGDGTPQHQGLKPGAYVRLSATDTGPGMPPEVLARASEPFFTTKGMGKGTGLGLAMVRGFAEQSGGGLSIESTLGQGTVIKIWLPIAKGAPLATTADEDGTSLAGADRAHSRLLLVDDDEPVRQMLSQELEAEGCAVLPAASGAEALGLLDAGEAVDLIISDLSMPGMDGVSVIREAQRRRPHLPAILLTGFATSAAGIALDAAVSGAFTLLRKPVRGRVLSERAAMLLGGRQPRGGVNRNERDPIKGRLFC